MKFAISSDHTTRVVSFVLEDAPATEHRTYGLYPESKVRHFQPTEGNMVWKDGVKTTVQVWGPMITRGGLSEKQRGRHLWDRRQMDHRYTDAAPDWVRLLWSEVG